MSRKFFSLLLSVPSHHVNLFLEECHWLTCGVSGVGSCAYYLTALEEDDSIT